MKIMIIYDSVFGNTEKIAQAIADGFKTQGFVDILPVNQVSVTKIKGLDLLIIGSPTRGFRPTEGISNLLKLLTKDQLNGTQVAAFDTRIALNTINSAVLRLMVDKGGYAANNIAKELRKKGGVLCASPAGFLVTGEQGPLQDGELQRATDWAKQIQLMDPKREL